MFPSCGGTAQTVPDQKTVPEEYPEKKQLRWTSFYYAKPPLVVKVTETVRSPMALT